MANSQEGGASLDMEQQLGSTSSSSFLCQRKSKAGQQHTVLLLQYISFYFSNSKVGESQAQGSQGEGYLLSWPGSRRGQTCFGWRPT